jgi:hypothetical protein
MVEAPNFPERMTKTAQVLSSLNENFFDFFDFAVKQFCESSVVLMGGGSTKQCGALFCLTFCRLLYPIRKDKTGMFANEVGARSGMRTMELGGAVTKNLS